MRHLGLGLLLAVLATPAGAAPNIALDPSQPAGPLIVTVTNVRRAAGHVRVEVCTKAEFLKSCVLSGAAAAVQGETQVVIPGVPPGVYAIQAFLDENDNHKVDRNRLGVPKEGVGFSHDANFFLGAPSFRAARFTVAPFGDVVRLKLRYMPG